jgi:ATP-dependent DNA helicase RecQ
VVFPDRTLIEMAEKRPATLDDMAHVSGVGAKKLATYGAAFLEVIAGAFATGMHPARRRLAGRAEGDIFDRLDAAQKSLARGPDGTGRLMSLGAPLLRRIAEARPASLTDLARHLDRQQVDRFGPALIRVLEETER